jgi:hypothetical protein
MLYQSNVHDFRPAHIADDAFVPEATRTSTRSPTQYQRTPHYSANGEVQIY